MADINAGLASSTPLAPVAPLAPAPASPGFFTGTFNGQPETQEQYNTRIGAISNPPPGATPPPAGTPPPVGTPPPTGTSTTPSSSGLLTNLNNNANQIDSAITDAQTNLNNVINGTIPLTPNQQAQIQALHDQFDQLRKQQLIVNKNYEAGITQAGIVSGRNEYAPEIEAGNITASINVGIQKIAQLDSQASDAISKMEEGFQQKNMDNIKAAFDLYTSALKMKQDNLQAMYNDVVQATKDARDFAYTQTQDAIKNTLASDKFNLDQANAVVDNALKTAQITKTEADTYYQQLQSKQLELQVSSPGNNGTAPVVNMTANNVPDPVGQSAYLAALPGGATGGLATLVQALASYDINPSAIPTRNYRGVAGMTQAQILTLVKQYDPSYSESLYATRQALRTNFTSGKYSQNINSLNTAIGHITDILSNTKGLGNIGFTPYNHAKNTIESIFGAGNIGGASLNIQAATSELASVFKGSGATDQEITALGSINSASSPDQVKHYIETATQLLSSRLQALNDTYAAGMGKAPTKSFLSLTSQQGLLNLQKSGLNIQVPELANSPLVKLQTFADSDPKNKALLDQLHQANPNLDPYGLEDLLSQNGISL